MFRIYLFLIQLTLALGFQSVGLLSRHWPHGLASVGVSFPCHRNSLKVPAIFPRGTLLHESSIAASSSSSSLYSTTSMSDTEPHLNSRQKPSPLEVLWRFSRPHTIIGSALAIPSLHLLAAPSYSTAFSKHALVGMVYAIVPSLLMNLYITGLNQITDVDIDKINKPNLPIAAGDLSRTNAIIIVLLSLLLSLTMGMAHPVYGTAGLNCTLWLSALLGTIYSLPPFRLKRYPLLAAFCIVAVRGAIINAGFYSHAQTIMTGTDTITTVAATATATTGISVWHYLKKMSETQRSSCFWSSMYFAMFGMVIALMKDIPDVSGDAQSNIRTFSVRWGPKQVFVHTHQWMTRIFAGMGLLFILKSGGVRLTDLVNGTANVGWTAIAWGNMVVGLACWWAGRSIQQHAAKVDPENPPQVYKFYMHLWKLFYVSYLVLPLAR